MPLHAFKDDSIATRTKRNISATNRTNRESAKCRRVEVKSVFARLVAADCDVAAVVLELIFLFVISGESELPALRAAD